MIPFFPRWPLLNLARRIDRSLLWLGLGHEGSRGPEDCCDGPCPISIEWNRRCNSDAKRADRSAGIRGVRFLPDRQAGSCGGLVIHAVRVVQSTG